MRIAEFGLRIRSARRRRGVSFLEVLGTFMILAFVTLGTVQLYRVGDKQQRTARNYANAQTGNREAIRRMLRTLRHGYAVQMSDSTWTGSPSSDTSSQIIVTVPQPSASGTDHVRFYLTGTTLYGQNGTGTATTIATGVQSMTLTYYQTTISGSTATTTDVSSTPGSATEVKIQIVSNSGGTTAGTNSTETAYVALRNAVLTAPSS